MVKPLSTHQATQLQTTPCLTLLCRTIEDDLAPVCLKAWYTLVRRGSEKFESVPAVLLVIGLT